MELDDAHVAFAPLVPFTGEGGRHLAPRYDPLDGEGARINGGRFNPPDSFPVLYICVTRRCTVAELRRLGERHAIGVEGLLPRYLYRYDIRLERVLDLTTDDAGGAVGIGWDALTGRDWTACQDLGVVAHSLAAQAVLAPSATGVDDVLAVFMQHLGPGVLEPELVEEWHTLDDVTGPGPRS